MHLFILFLAALVPSAPLHGEERGGSESFLRSAVRAGAVLQAGDSSSHRPIVANATILDATYRWGTRLELGLRTLAEASGDPVALYRLTSGPLVVYALSEGWQIQGQIGYFSESKGSDTDWVKRSGVGGNVGWERSVSLSPKVACLYGGFFAFYGNQRLRDSAKSEAFLSRYWSVIRNQARGVAVGLRVTL